MILLGWKVHGWEQQLLYDMNHDEEIWKSLPRKPGVAEAFLLLMRVPA